MQHAQQVMDHGTEHGGRSQSAASPLPASMLDPMPGWKGSPTRMLGGGLLLALAYASLAVSTQKFLFFEPAYASPIWAAAGLAIVGLLVGGLRLWPAVAAGYLLFRLMAYWDGSWDTLGAATVMGLAYAVGPTVQAVLGAALVRPGLLAMLRGQDHAAMRVLLLAGPIACLVAPSLGVVLLVQHGRIDIDTALSNWLIWWVGDSVGVLLAGPLFLLAVPAVRALWQGRARTVVWPLIGAAALLLVSVGWFHDQERLDAHEPKKLQMALAHNAFKTHMNDTVQALHIVADHFADDPAFSESNFVQLASSLDLAGLVSLQWFPAPRPGQVVDQPQMRYAYSGLPDALGGAPAAPPHIDVAAHPEAVAALQRAADSGQISTGGPIRLDPQMPSMMVLAVPASRSSANVATPAGTLLAFLDLRVFARALVQAGEPARVGFDLVGVSSAGAAVSWLRTSDTMPSDAGFFWEQPLRLPDRELLLRVYAGTDFWLPGQSTRSRLFLLSMLLAAFQVTLYALSVAGRERAIARTVERRTAQIAEGQRKLEGAMDIARMVDWDLLLEQDEAVFLFDDRYFRFLRTDAQREGGYRMTYTAWVRAFVQADDGPMLLQELAHARSAGYEAPDHGLEFRMVCRDGTPLHVMARFTRVLDSDGRVTRLLGTCQDVSERKAIDLALRQSEEYNRSIVESSRDCIAMLDLDGRLLDMTAYGCKRLGIADLDAVRYTDWFATWQPDAARARAVVRAAGNGSLERMQVQMSASGQTPGWWDLMVSPVRGVDGQVARLLLVARDITAEHEATMALARINADLESEVQRRSQALIASEHRLRATFEVAAVGIAHFDPQGRLLRANPTFCAISQYTESELKALGVCQLLHPDDRARNKELNAELAAGTRASFVQEQRYLRNDGSAVWVQVSGSAVRDEAGELLYRVVIVEDIDATRRARELALASAQRYRDLFESNPVPMWTYDTQTLRLTAVNTAAVVHYGYSREEFLRMNLFDLRAPQDHTQLRWRLAERREGFVPAHEIWHQRKDGTRLLVEVTAHDVLNDGPSTRMVLAHDITDRKRAEALVAGQNAVLGRIATSAGLDKTLEALCELLESDSADMIGSVLLLDSDGQHLRHAASSRLPPEYIQAIDGVAIGPRAGSCGTAAHRAQAVVVADIAADPLWQDYRQLALDHDLRACCAVPILDAFGKVLGTFAAYFTRARSPSGAELDRLQALTQTAAIAITKDSERSALEESEARFRAIYETAPVGIMLVARDGRILAANPRQCAVTGYSEAELATRRVQEMVHADTPAEFLARDMDELESVWRGDRESYALSKRATRPDGTDYWIEVFGCVVRDRAGEGLYSIRIVLDVTDRVMADVQMRLREEQFRQTFELAALGIGHVGRSGLFQRVNPRLCEITGYSEEELLQRGPADLTYADDNEEGFSKRDRLWNGEIASYTLEKRYVRKDGVLVWTNVTVSAVRDQHGAIDYAVGILEDISRRKNAEIELHHQQELNRLLLENLTEGVVACDDKGKLIMFNKAAREWHGVDTREIDAQDWARYDDLYLVDGHTPLPADQIPLMRALRGEQVRNAEMSIVRNGAQAKVVLASGAPLLDAGGRHRGAVVVMHDITERQRTLDQLRWMNELSEAFNGLADPLAILAVATRMLGRYLRVSRCCFAEEQGSTGVWKVVRDHVDGVASLVGSVPLTLRGAHTGRQLRSGGTLVIHDVEEQLPGVAGAAFRSDGVHAALSAAVGGDGQQRALMAVHQTTPRVWARDEIALVRTVAERCWTIVERERSKRELRQAAEELQAAHREVEHERALLAQRVQERTAELVEANHELARARDVAEQASRTKSAFLATVSHEIRTPMNGVLGAMELLEHTGLDGERGTLLHTAQNSARSLLGLLNDLLDMAKIEAGRIEIIPAPSNVQAIVEQVLSIHHPAALSRGITLVSHIDTGTPAWLLLDSLRVCQILGNLVSNAVKFTSHGGVELDLRASDLGSGWYRVRFSVRDSGAGIAPEVLASLFQPFEQGGAAMARRSGGSGLGLAICRGLSEQMGGEVTLESEPGRGTIARLELVLRQAAEVPAQGRMDSQDSVRVVSRFLGDNALAASANALPILVVDDHPVNRQLLLRQLALLGLKADDASDGVQALQKLRTGRFGLVISDCEMPRMDGYMLAQEIRRGTESWRSMPVIAYTAHAMPEVVKRCLASGMDEVMTKPVPVVELARVLRKWWPQLMAEGLQRDLADQPVGVADDDAGADAPTLDAEQLEQMTGGDREIERALIDDFRHDGAGTMDELSEAIARGEASACRRLAHRSKGACMVVGARALAKLFAELEAATLQDASAAHWEEIRHRIVEAFARLDVALQRRLADMPPGVEVDDAI